MQSDKKSIRDLRTEAGMTRKQFCEYFDIPYRTLQDWELHNRHCPEYVTSLIEYKLTKEGLINEKTGNV